MIGRFAMTALKKAGHFLKTNAGNSAGEVAFRVVPDLGFGMYAATQTPGDFGDKLIAGATQAAGGVLGGIGTAGAIRSVMPGAASLQNLGDMAGSFAGDFAGMAVGDNAMRLKDKISGGSGMTPYERLGAEQQALMAEQIRKQMMAQYGLSDPSTGMGVS